MIRYKHHKLAGFLVFCMIMLLFPYRAKAEINGPDVRSESYCVMDPATGEVILMKNMYEQLYPASITKILTALVVLENCSDLNEMLTFSENAITSLTNNSSTMSPMGAIGETMSVRDALYGMMLCSGNECANALAEHVGGSIEAFAEMMNARAAKLGAKDSHFVNAHGLTDPYHYTSAYDMALIFREALKNKEFLKIDSTKIYTIPATNMYPARGCGMGHKMVTGEIACEGVYAGKTGSTAEAGKTLVTASNRNGQELIVVTMKSGADAVYSDTQILFEYGFAVEKGEYSPVEWSDISETVWATGDVTIREFPSVHALARGTLAVNTSVTRLGEYEGWSKVQIEANTYYVASSYLTNQDPANPVSETSAQTLPEETTEEETTTQEQTTEASTAVSTADRMTTAAASLPESKEASVTPATESEGDGLSVSYIVIIAAVSVVGLLVLAVLVWILIKSRVERRRRIKRRRHYE